MSSAEYSALSQQPAGKVEAALDDEDGEPIEELTMDDDTQQPSLNTESDDDDYLQVELDDSYRPPSSTTSSGPTTRTVLCISLTVITLLMLLVGLVIAAMVYSDTLLSNARAASALWSSLLGPPNGATATGNTHNSHIPAIVPAISIPDEVHTAHENTEATLPENDEPLPTTPTDLSKPTEPMAGTEADQIHSSESVPASLGSVSSLVSATSSSASLSESSSPPSSSASLLAPASAVSAVPSSSSASLSHSSALPAASGFSLVPSAAAVSPPLQDKTAKPALLAHLSSYIDRHYSPNMTLQPDRKYLVFTPTDDGLGNKLLPLVSSFFLALILDRTWLIHWVGTEAVHNSKVNIEQVFRPPDGMYWSWSDIVDRTKLKLDKQDAIGDQHILFRTELCNVAGVLSLNCSAFDTRGAGDDIAADKVPLSCADWRSMGRYADTVIVNWGDQYYIPQLQVNAAYRPFITSLFDEDDIFGPLSRFLLRPSDAVQSYISDMQSRFWTDRYVVSMQMRRRERLGLRDPEVNTAIMCAKRLAAEGKAATGKEVTFFVASDDAQLRDSLISRMLPDGQVVHVSNFSIREEQTGVFFAAVDVILLSRGDAIVTTPSSTFGYISAGFGSLVPWRVQLWPGKDCVRAINSEPSSHFFHSMVGYSKRQPFCVDLTQFDHLMQQETCCPRW